MKDETLTFIRQQLKSTLLQTQADPMSVAWRVFPIATRGPHHPYARLPTAGSYDNVTLGDCQRFFGDFLHLGGAHLTSPATSP